MPEDNKNFGNLLKSIWKLTNTLKILKQNSLVEKYNYFIEHSDKGDNCTYAQKCLLLFRNEGEYELVKNDINLIISTIDQIEGSPNWRKK